MMKIKNVIVLPEKKKSHSFRVSFICLNWKNKAKQERLKKENSLQDFFSLF